MEGCPLEREVAHLITTSPRDSLACCVGGSWVVIEPELVVEVPLVTVGDEVASEAVGVTPVRFSIAGGRRSGVQTAPMGVGTPPGSRPYRSGAN